MSRPGGPDVLIVSLGSTSGLVRADEALGDSLRRAGASVALARAQAPAPVPTMVLTDLGWARAARAAALAALARSRPRAIVYSSTTAALLWPRPGAIRFDAASCANRRGRHGLWQRPLERRRLGQAALLVPWSEGALAEAGLDRSAGLVVPVPVQPSGPPAPKRDIAAITYGANPHKKGLDRVLAAWRELRARVPGQELVVAGVCERALRRSGIELGDGVRATGMLGSGEYRELLRRARTFVCAPRREDYGLAQLEALADGCMLVTTPAPGPYAALPIARRLDGRLVGEDLAGALATALADPSPGYAERARAELSPLHPEAVDRLVAGALLPRLLA